MGNKGTWQGEEMWFCCKIASCLPAARLLPGEALGTVTWLGNTGREDEDMQDAVSQGHLDCSSYGSFISGT